jgi:hypothetical protein
MHSAFARVRHGGRRHNRDSARALWRSKPMGARTHEEKSVLTCRTCPFGRCKVCDGVRIVLYAEVGSVVEWPPGRIGWGRLLSLFGPCVNGLLPVDFGSLMPGKLGDVGARVKTVEVLRVAAGGEVADRAQLGVKLAKLLAVRAAMAGLFSYLGHDSIEALPKLGLQPLPHGLWQVMGPERVAILKKLLGHLPVSRPATFAEGLVA